MCRSRRELSNEYLLAKFRRRYSRERAPRSLGKNYSIFFIRVLNTYPVLTRSIPERSHKTQAACKATTPFSAVDNIRRFTLVLTRSKARSFRPHFHVSPHKSGHFFSTRNGHHRNADQAMWNRTTKTEKLRERNEKCIVSRLLPISRSNSSRRAPGETHGAMTAS